MKTHQNAEQPHASAVVEELEGVDESNDEENHHSQWHRHCKVRKANSGAIEEAQHATRPHHPQHRGQLWRGQGHDTRWHY